MGVLVALVFCLHRAIPVPLPSQGMQGGQADHILHEKIIYFQTGWGHFPLLVNFT